MIPYGDLDITSLPNVVQDDPTRTIQGADGVTLHTIAVDAQGRLIMLPYGWDGTAYRKLRVDEEGRMVAVMKGQADVKWGLRGWWKFVGSEGTTIKDYSGFGNNGLAYSGVGLEAKYTGGVIGEALQFDGLDDYIDCGEDPSLEVTAEITLEAWINPATLVGAHRIIDRLSGDPYRPYSLLQDSDELKFVLYTDARTTLAVGNVITDVNIWYYIVATYDGAYMRIYVNGSLVGIPVANTGAIDYTSAPHVNIARAQVHGNYFEGLIDEARIYNRALTPDEVAWRYEQTNPLNPKPTRMIAVDGEGRMMVNVNDLPYKDTVMIKTYVNDHPSGEVKVEFDPVPSGKLWVITNVICTCMLDDTGATTLYIRRDDEYYMIEQIMRRTTFDTLSYHGPAYLKAGDIIACWFSSVDIDKPCAVYVTGYALDAP